MRSVMLTMVAGGLVTLAAGSAIRADDDTFRLGTSSAGTASAVTGDIDTLLVRGGGGRGVGGRGGFAHGGGFRGGGFRGGYGGGFRGGYGYGGGYRGGFGYAGFRGGYGYYGSYGGYGYYRPYVYGGYYPSVYYSPNYYYDSTYYSTPYYYPMSGQVTISTPTVRAQLPVQDSQPGAVPYQYQSMNSPQRLPMPVAPPQSFDPNQTFPYDGGPHRCRTPATIPRRARNRRFR